VAMSANFALPAELRDDAHAGCCTASIRGDEGQTWATRDLATAHCTDQCQRLPGIHERQCQKPRAHILACPWGSDGAEAERYLPYAEHSYQPHHPCSCWPLATEPAGKEPGLPQHQCAGANAQRAGPVPSTSRVGHVTHAETTCLDHPESEEGGADREIHP
jgi:hypothetical protein